MRHGVAATVGLLVAGLTASFTGATPLIAQGNRLAAVEPMLLEENWDGVKRLFDDPSTDVCVWDPIARMLYGHASLLTGETSKAVRHFYCPVDSTRAVTTDAWVRWTTRLASRHSDVAVVHYLHGDALARSGDLPGAKAAFDLAAEINPRHAAALNARGVTKWILFEQAATAKMPEWESYELEAEQDLIDAAAASPNLADAWANRGLITLRSHGAIVAAVTHFDRALAIEPMFWLALNGKAVAAGASGRSWDFQRHVDSIQAHAPDTPFLQLNADRLDDGDVRADGRRGRAISASDLDFKLRLGNVGVDLKVGSFEFGMLGRGGIYMYLKEGENVRVVGANDGPRVIGTWFTMNYPSAPIDGTSPQ